MKHSRLLAARFWQHFVIAALPFLLCSCRQLELQNAAAPEPLSDRQVAVLNALRDEINATYCFVDRSPRINRGPCGRFAKIFREQWNARFKDKINIVFVMAPEISDGVGCDHVLVKLPDGHYFDGGGGVMTAAKLLENFRRGDRIEEMVEFDPALLDQRSYGLGRSYELCPNYSDETTTRIIEKYLAVLRGD
jgi:hypothetical protein